MKRHERINTLDRLEKFRRHLAFPGAGKKSVDKLSVRVEARGGKRNEKGGCGSRRDHLVLVC